MDSTSIMMSVDSTEKLLSQLRDVDPTKVPPNIMSQLNKLYEKFGYLLSYWEIYNKMGYFEYKIDDSLWMDNYIMKFLFEGCITYATNNRTGTKDLFCTICNAGFPCDGIILNRHLMDAQHTTNFINDKKKIKDFVWNEAIVYKCAFEKFIDYRVDNTLYCKICGYTIPFNHTSLVGHLDGKKHKKNFKDIMMFKSNCEHNAATAVNKEEPFFENPDTRSPIRQEEPRSAYTSETYQTVNDYSASKIIDNSKQFADNRSNKDVNGRPVKSGINKYDSRSSSRLGISLDKYESDNVSLSSVTGEGRWDEISEKSFGASPRNPSKKMAGNENYKKNVNAQKPLSRINKSDSMSSLRSGTSFERYESDNVPLSGLPGFATSGGRQDEFSEKSFGGSPWNPDRKVITYPDRTGNKNFKETEINDGMNNTEKHFNRSRYRGSNYKKSGTDDKKSNPEGHFKKRRERTRNRKEVGTDDKKRNAEKYFEQRREWRSNKSGMEETKKNTEKHSENRKERRNFDEHLEKKEDEINIDKPCWCGIDGVPPDVTEGDIKQGFSNLGVVNSVRFLDSNKVNVEVNLRIGVNFVINWTTVLIKNKDYTLKEKFSSVFPDFKSSSAVQNPSAVRNLSAKKLTVVDFPDEVKVKFCVYHESFFETLLSNAVQESESSLTLFNVKYLKTEKVLDELTSTLKHKYSSDLKVVTIGSRATGLANSDSLHDIFIDIGNYYEDESSNEDKLMERLNDIKKCLENSQYPSFNNIQVDGEFLLFVHGIAKMNCKIFCSSGMAVENTQLIRSYVIADENIKLLIIIIREWIKFTNLSDLLSNYSITWMVLFFLMQPSVNYIKPVEVLKSAYQEPLKSISGWDCGFCNVDPSSVLCPDREIKPVIQLLLNFFKFYSNLEVKANVLCPLTGELVSKPKFEAKSLLACSFSKYIAQEKKMNVTNGICLQDPLELDRNLTEGMTGDFYDAFKFYCKKMVDMISFEFPYY